MYVHVRRSHPSYDITWPMTYPGKHNKEVLYCDFVALGATRAGARDDCGTLDRSPLWPSVEGRGAAEDLPWCVCWEEEHTVYPPGPLRTFSEFQAPSVSAPMAFLNLDPHKAHSCFQTLPSFTPIHSWLKVF